MGYFLVTLMSLQAIDIGLVVYNTEEQTGYISSATTNENVSATTTPAGTSSTTGWFKKCNRNRLLLHLGHGKTVNILFVTISHYFLVHTLES